MYRLILILFVPSLFAEDIRVPEQFNSIQAGIDAAGEGTSVVVSPGTYFERLTLKPGITVKSVGVQAAETIVDGSKGPMDRAGITMADRSVLDGFTVTGVGTYDDAKWKKHYATKGEQQSHEHIGELGQPAISVTNGVVTIRNNIVHHNGFTGIGISGSNCTVQVVNNQCYRNMGGGIGLMDGMKGTIEANVCYENFYAGIGHDDASPVITNNVCYGNIRAGIGISHNADPIVGGNRCYQNRRAGIGIRSAGTKPRIINNDCYDNGMAGIGVRQEAAPEIIGNRCYSNELAGIGARMDAHPIIRNNVVFGNQAAGIGLMQTEAGAATLSGNHVYDNATVAVAIQSGWKVTLTKNKLSTAKGMPPVIMLFKGAEGVFKSNQISGPGVAGLRVGGKAVVGGNHFDGVKLRKAGPPQFGVWILEGGEVKLEQGNTFKNWRKTIQGTVVRSPAILLLEVDTALRIDAEQAPFLADLATRSLVFDQAFAGEGLLLNRVPLAKWLNRAGWSFQECTLRPGKDSLPLDTERPEPSCFYVRIQSGASKSKALDQTAHWVIEQFTGHQPPPIIMFISRHESKAVPMLVHWEGKVKPGRTDILIDGLDILPTLLEMAGIEAVPSADVSGQSFYWKLNGEKGVPRDWVAGKTEGRWWIRDQDWKFYQSGELFHVAKDPEEKVSLSRYSNDSVQIQMRGWLQSELALLLDEQQKK